MNEEVLNQALSSLLGSAGVVAAFAYWVKSSLAKVDQITEMKTKQDHMIEKLAKIESMVEQQNKTHVEIPFIRKELDAVWKAVDKLKELR